jgi:hypothetical protein
VSLAKQQQRVTPDAETGCALLSLLLLLLLLLLLMQWP